jgi:hypothetical protein
MRQEIRANAAYLTAVLILLCLPTLTARAAQPPRLRLSAGQQRVFPPSRLLIGQEVACRVGRVTALARVPARGQSRLVTVRGVTNGATLRLRTRADRSVIASCR